MLVVQLLGFRKQSMRFEKSIKTFLSKIGGIKTTHRLFGREIVSVVGRSLHYQNSGKFLKE